MVSGKRRGFIISILSFIILVLISLYFDSRIASSMKFIRTNFLNTVFTNVGSLGMIFVLIVVLTALFVKENKKQWILPLWFASGLSVVTSCILKMLIQRPRPFQQGLISLVDGIGKVGYSTWDFSFPSFHTMIIFATLPFLDKEFRKFRFVWIALALIIGFSRVYLGLHFLSDVLVGGLVGYLIGRAVIVTEKKNKFWEKVYKKIFR